MRPTPLHSTVSRTATHPFLLNTGSQHGSKVLGEVTVEQVFGGMRGIKAMLWEPSVLDSEEGIRFWGRTIPECQEVLPTAPGGKEMLPEAMFWYLLTGKVPTAEETVQFQNELVKRSVLPSHIESTLDALREFLSTRRREGRVSRADLFRFARPQPRPSTP